MIMGQTFELPIYLEEKIDNMGVMSVFDGEIEQMNQYSNFSYSGYNYTMTIYNTVNTNNLKTLVDSVFTINWGDGFISGLTMPTISTTTLPYITHTYSSTPREITIEITIESPWNVESIKKSINLPFVNDYGWYPPGGTNFGTLIYDVPSYELTDTTSITQDYLYDYRNITGTTEPTLVSFMGIGKSRLEQYRKYGTGNTFSIPTVTGTTTLGIYTGYTIDGLSYFDYSDGTTYITGTTSGTTEVPYINEEVYNGMLTREEFLIGFIDEPEIYSDIFIERGKQSVIERNIRLGEIDNVGELEIYGGGFFKVKKQ